MTSTTVPASDTMPMSIKVASRLSYLGARTRAELPAKFLNFLDVAGTSVSVGSYYETDNAQLEAAKQSHLNMISAERGIYTLALCLPGATNFSMQLGITALLSNPRKTTCLLTETEESMAIEHMMRSLPITYRLRMIVWLRIGRVTTARSRRLITKTVLADDNFSYWCIKYRNKIAVALKRALGVKAATAFMYHRWTPDVFDSRMRWDGQAMARWVLGADYADIKRHRGGETVGWLETYYGARVDLERGALLPTEVLEGIRRQYHPHIAEGRVIEMTSKSGSMTSGEKLAKQNKAAKSHVSESVKMTAADWRKHDAVKLYIYAYKNGMTPEIRGALDEKARHAANGLPISFSKLSIVIDYSASMRGSKEQGMRPIACAMALRDMLMAATTGRDANVITTGHPGPDDRLPQPHGGTDLGGALIQALKMNPDAVVIITDGFENSPAGRVHQILGGMKQLKQPVAVYQLTPVMAASSGGIRKLSPLLSALPIFDPKSMGLGLLKGSFEASLEQGAEVLMNTALPIVQKSVKQI